MAVKWVQSADDAFSRAKSESHPVLLDFSAAPA